MFQIHVAETSRIDGSLEGGYIIDCNSQEEFDAELADLYSIIDREVLTDEYPCNSLMVIATVR